MLKILDVEEARRTVLKREVYDDTTITPALRASIQSLFGEPLSPQQVVARILADVKQRGDDALLHWTTLLDGYKPERLRVPEDELRTAWENLPAAQKEALKLAAGRIRSFHEQQPLNSWITHRLGGTMGQFVRPVRRVGIYIPAGTAPLPSSVLMSVIPAQVAGVPQIVLVTPPQRESGKVSPSILAAAALLEVQEVYMLGGAQAIAALAYGTPSIPAVKKIFGPGNLFVTLAKKQVFGVVGIDGLAGPTETVVIADDSARPEWVAADLLAQAEHDVEASAILLTPSRELAEAVSAEVARQSSQLKRQKMIASSLAAKSAAVITADLEEAVALANEYAPEHLCLAVRDAWRWAEKITSAGGVFAGEHSFEVLGDYVAGPSHVMPTGGSAHFASPLNVWDFVHLVSLIALDAQTAERIAPMAATLALTEGLDGHAQAALRRL